MEPSSRPSPFALVVMTVGALVVLAGCRSLPVPIQFDLLAELGDAATGVVEESVLRGSASSLTLDLPEHDDNCIDVDTDRLPVTAVQGRLTYEVAVTAEGPQLSGTVRVEPYVAANRSDLWRPESALGSPIVVDVSSSAFVLADDVHLTAAQLAGLNGGRLCWGLRLRGTDLAALDDGTLRVGYEVRTLLLRVGVAVF
jgi:hypothetical protein